MCLLRVHEGLLGYRMPGLGSEADVTYKLTSGVCSQTFGGLGESRRIFDSCGRRPCIHSSSHSTRGRGP
jgi:hypothetical protein